MPTPAVTRKRSRAQHLEQDELQSEVDHAPLSSAKKRKLNTKNSLPVALSSLGSIRKSIGGLFGFKKTGKENRPGQEKDELADSSEADDTVNNVEKDIWEVEDSESEDTAAKRRRNGLDRSRPDTTPKSAKSRTPKGSGKAQTGAVTPDGEERDVYAVTDSPPRRSSGRKPTTSVERAKALLVPDVNDKASEKKRTPGRPRKSDILKQAKMLSKQAARSRLTAAEERRVHEEEDTATTPRGRGRKAHIEEEDTAQESPSSVTTSKNVKRGRPAKSSFSADAIESLQGPKGILTSSKPGIRKSRKSVAFEEGGEIDLGFKDVPQSASTKLKRVKKKDLGATTQSLGRKSNNIPVEEEQEEEGPEVKASVDEQEEDDDSQGSDDDEMCGICSGLESTKKNPILFCDGAGCNIMVHRDCYEVEKVPPGDWFCRGCQAETADEILFSKLDDKSALTESPSNIPDVPDFEDHFNHMQRILLDRLTGQTPIRLRGHDEEMQKVHQVVEQTVLAGEGNSMLVIGARGSGKSTLVDSVISDLSQEHRQSFHIVRLNGFIHTDDKLALKDTWRQLGREMELEDDATGRTSNYSDTLASLLALLSHPSEISESEPEQTAKSVIFILDEFDLFTTHPRQTLLYNLFDIAQARKAPIVVLGLTTRVDVVESLEKRVKSRFSHRYVHLSLPRSIPAFWDICKAGLSVGVDKLDDESKDLGLSEEFVFFWQSMVEDLYNQDALFKHHVQSEFYRTKSVSAFFTSCIVPIANLLPTKLPLTGKLFTNTLSAPDSKLDILRGLSELELAILIAAARLDIILDTDTCNFAMAYDEYSSLTSRYKIQTSSTGVTALGAGAKVWGREVALGAWETLAEYGLLVPAGIGGGGAKDFGAGGRMWKIDVGLEEITGSVDGLSGIMAKWCREI